VCVCVFVCNSVANELTFSVADLMADINYNEATHSIVYTQDGASVCPGLDPMFHWEARFPERLSRLHLTSDMASVHPASICISPLSRRRQERRSRANRAAAVAAGTSGRFRTQPITIDEIAEVDEDQVAQTAATATHTTGNHSPPAADAGMTTGDNAPTTNKDTKVLPNYPFHVSLTKLY